MHTCISYRRIVPRSPIELKASQAQMVLSLCNESNEHLFIQEGKSNILLDSTLNAGYQGPIETMPHVLITKGNIPHSFKLVNKPRVVGIWPLQKKAKTKLRNIERDNRGEMNRFFFQGRGATYVIGVLLVTNVCKAVSKPISDGVLPTNPKRIR